VWSVRNSSELAPATHDLGDPALQAMSPGRNKGASMLAQVHHEARALKTAQLRLNCQILIMFSM